MNGRMAHRLFLLTNPIHQHAKPDKPPFYVPSTHDLQDPRCWRWPCRYSRSRDRAKSCGGVITGHRGKLHPQIFGRASDPFFEQNGCVASTQKRAPLSDGAKTPNSPHNALGHRRALTRSRARIRVDSIHRTAHCINGHRCCIGNAIRRHYEHRQCDDRHRWPLPAALRQYLGGG